MDRLRIEPYRYMVRVLSELPSAATDKDLDGLLPWNQDEAMPV
ncbi:transposase domain-containing protein [Marinobacter lacisalsi]|uniref:Transposase domain-containing protein n=1 Tax=Marinobacter lacisalsi TaxID=475979 RepID=A0ABV8QF11_9GAMM